MKKLYKLLLFAVVAVLLSLFAATTAFAMPARPGSGISEAACKSHTGSLVTLDDIPSVNAKRVGKKAYAPSLNKANKNIPLAIIVIGFDNAPYDNSADWNEIVFMHEKSISKFYSDMSSGQFTFEPAKETSAFNTGNNTNVSDKVNDGIIHIKSSIPHDRWIDLEGEELQSFAEVLIDAINQAAEYIDFASFDADGDGEIETNEFALGFVVGGYEASATEDYEILGADKYLWAHAYSIADAFEELEMDDNTPTPGGVRVSNYIAFSEFVENDDGPAQLATTNTLAHELGHYLGLPDLYDTAYNTDEIWSEYSVGYLSVMDVGSWGIDLDGTYTPYSFDPWSRYVLGWYEPETVTTSGEFTVKAAVTDPANDYNVLRVPTGRKNEYYLVENRQFAGWDSGMSTYYDKAGSNGGLVFWHIDDDVYDAYASENEVNNTDHRPAVMPLFVEYTNAGKATLIGDLVETMNPFFSKSMVDKLLPELEGAVDLPLYGAGDEADIPAARTFSGIKVAPLDDSDAEMNVEVITYITPDEPDTPETPDDDTSDVCPYCHKTHGGNFFDKIVGFFHKIFYFFRNLFKFR